jgi:hypothetical protein
MLDRRKRETKGASFSYDALYLDVTSELLNDTANNGKP